MQRNAKLVFMGNGVFRKRQAFIGKSVVPVNRLLPNIRRYQDNKRYIHLAAVPREIFKVMDPFQRCARIFGRVGKAHWNNVRKISTEVEIVARKDCDRSYNIAPVTFPESSLTTWLSEHVSNFTIADLTDIAQYRSKRMILDTLGVGVRGARTDISATLREFAKTTEGIGEKGKALIWGTNNLKTSVPMAAYLNGSSCHSMDFDDTWHPATHPSSPVLPVVLALVEYLPKSSQPSMEDILVAYNIGVEVQGVLLRSSPQARNIPHRLHPPAIVGVMGSAAAASRLLGHGPQKCRHAMAIAASFAGAPMANAGTTTKPLHAGKSARFGLEAALLADGGIEGNPNILDMESGFGAFYADFNPSGLLEHLNQKEHVILHYQDIALKRFPCHLGMHWAIDASLRVREEIINTVGHFSVSNIDKIEILAPKSKYINRPIPNNEHDARHSFQFTTCSALLDGEVTPNTFHFSKRQRHNLLTLLKKTHVHTPEDNIASFDNMYVQIRITMENGSEIEARCDTPYCHWRNPLSDADVKRKFYNNVKCLQDNKQRSLVQLVSRMPGNQCALDLIDSLHI